MFLFLCKNYVLKTIADNLSLGVRGCQTSVFLKAF